MSSPWAHQIIPDATMSARIAGLDSRLRRLERDSWRGLQRKASAHEPDRAITSNTYALDQFMPMMPVFVPEGGQVSVYAAMRYTLSHSGFGRTWIRGALFELTDSGDPFYAGQQIVEDWQISGNLTRTRGSHPARLEGVSEQIRMLTYRPTPGERIYQLKIHSQLDDTGAGNFATLRWARATVEVR